MEKMTDELKETIVREHPEGIRIVLAEENQLDVVTAYDLLCGKQRAKILKFPDPGAPAANGSCGMSHPVF